MEVIGLLTVLGLIYLLLQDNMHFKLEVNGKTILEMGTTTSEDEEKDKDNTEEK